MPQQFGGFLRECLCTDPAWYMRGAAQWGKAFPAGLHSAHWCAAAGNAQGMHSPRMRFGARVRCKLAVRGGCLGFPGTAPGAVSGSPCSNSYPAAYAWFPTVRRGSDVRGSPSNQPALGLAGEIPRGAGEYPQMRRRMGFVGAWRFARPLPIATGGTRQQATRLPTLLAGPPLGALRRCVRGLTAPASPADSALGNSEGGSGWRARAQLAHAGRDAPRRGPCARRPSN